MRKNMLRIAACLLCLLAAVSVSLAEEASVLGEWYVIELSEDNYDVLEYSTGVGAYQKFSLTPRTNGVSLFLERGSVTMFSGDFYCGDEHFFVVLMQGDPAYELLGTTFLFYSSDTDAEGNPAHASAQPTFFAKAEMSLFTPTEMFFCGERLEYYLLDNRLYLIDGSTYASMQLEWLHQDVFIARPQDGSNNLLFVRTKD